MYAKNIIFLAAASLIADAMAVNVHRHAHNQVHKNQKKDLVIETEVATVTEWVTITYDPNAPTTTANLKFVEASRSKTRTRQYSQVASSSAAPAPAETSVPSVAEPAPSSPNVVEVPTTLIPQVKPTSIDIIVAAPAPTEAPAAPAAPAPTTEAEAPAPAPTTASAAPAAAVPASSGGNKRGVAFNDPELAKKFLGSGSKISFAYNWGQTNDLGVDHVNFYPMLWSPGELHEPTWNANANKAIAAGSKVLLSFNEPDNSGQANMLPAAAAAEHQRLMNPFAGKAQISTPAITNSGNPGEGVDWLRQWLEKCAGQCHFDYVAMHWYSDWAPSFFEQIEKVYNLAKKPILLTEFATNAPLNAVDFLKEVVPQLDADSRVAGYCYFMAKEGSGNDAMISGGQPNKIGNVFAFN
ncbi:glycosyl hydrolase catalytic core-domain-containing protein [Coniochaeta sp. 2T2.1]|nr:glycosyl hydrolase catalytic core-domain-containing protein [Coniochaeta sp. 2T2.1]